MNFDDYQNATRETAIYPGNTAQTSEAVIYCALGLVGEAGEVANKVKKIVRDDMYVITDTKRREISQELGDVLWYVARLADELDLSLTEISRQNLDKLILRKQCGKIRGNGDER